MSDASSTAATAADAPSAPKPRGLVRRFVRLVLRLSLTILGPVAILAVGAWIYVATGGEITTENAYVKADTIAVSTDVDGRVSKLHVREHQRVAAGQLLFELDRRPFQIALQNAEARLGVVRNEIESYRGSYRQKVEEMAMAKDDLEFARREHQRQQRLSQNGIVAKSAYDEALRKRRRAEQMIPAVREAMAATLSNLGGNPELAVEDHPSYQQALTERDEALLNLDYTKVRSPVAGVVSNLRLQSGEYVEAGEAAFAVVSSGSLYITANLKETQLTHVAVGQIASVKVDAYPGVEWQATVESISPATGSEFSVLPAQNATGNWVKVVQRLPVRLQIDHIVSGHDGDAQDAAPIPLRAGMSLEVTIGTGYERPVPPALRDAHARLSQWLEPRLEAIAGWLRLHAYAQGESS